MSWDDLDWDGLCAELLGLMKQHVGVNVILSPAKTVLAGFQGILLNTKTGYSPEDPNEQLSIILRVQSEGTEDISFVHIFKPVFKNAGWVQEGGARSLVVVYGDFTVMITPE